MSTSIKQVYVAFTNSDCTEGRGYDIPIAVCELEITAMRLAKNQYVQGSDGPVRSFEVKDLDGVKYIPVVAVPLHKATKLEQEAQNLLDSKRQVIAKAKAAGLTQNELDTLSRTV